MARSADRGSRSAGNPAVRRLGCTVLVRHDKAGVYATSAAPDDEHSSRRRARDRCIAGAVRESVQLEVGVEVQQRCFQRQSISRGRAIQCLPTFARMTGSKRRRTHIARRGRSMGATVRVATPRRCNLESRRPPARHGTSGLPTHPSVGLDEAHARCRHLGGLAPGARNQRTAIVRNPRLVGAARASSGRSLLAHTDRAESPSLQRARRTFAYAPQSTRRAEARLARGEWEVLGDARAETRFRGASARVPRVVAVVKRALG